MSLLKQKELLLHKLMYGRLDVDMNVNMIGDVSSRATRCSEDLTFYERNEDSEFGKRSILSCATRFFNNIPKEIQLTAIHTAFKKKLKVWLLETNIY